MFLQSAIWIRPIVHENCIRVYKKQMFYFTQIPPNWIQINTLDHTITLTVHTHAHKHSKWNALSSFSYITPHKDYIGTLYD